MSKRMTDLLALSHVPRWSIVDHSRHQSVADHTFRVMVIAIELAERIGTVIEPATMKAILFHDASESRTADIPNPAKEFLFRNGVINPHSLDIHFCPWLVNENLMIPSKQSFLFHLADKIEGATFIARYAIGPHAHSVAQRCFAEVHEMIAGHPQMKEIHKVMEEIMCDSGRINW